MHRVSDPPRRQGHAPPGWRELQGVREQVEQDLLDAPLVSLDRPDGRTDVEGHADALAGRALANETDAVL